MALSRILAPNRYRLLWSRYYNRSAMLCSNHQKAMEMTQVEIPSLDRLDGNDNAIFAGSSGEFPCLQK